MNDKKDVENSKVINNISDQENIETLIVEEEITHDTTTKVDTTTEIKQTINVEKPDSFNVQKYQSNTNANKKIETLTEKDMPNVNTRNTNIKKPTGRMSEENNNSNFNNNINKKSSPMNNEIVNEEKNNKDEQQLNNRIPNEREENKQNTENNQKADSDNRETKDIDKKNSRDNNIARETSHQKKPTRDVTNKRTNPLNKQDIEKTPGNYLKDKASEGLKNKFNDIKSGLAKKGAEKAAAAGAKKLTQEGIEKAVVTFISKNPYVLAIIVVILMLLLLLLIIAGSTSTAYGGEIAFDENTYWWPIGSSEVTTRNGIRFADGDPVPTVITSVFGNRQAPTAGASTDHGGLDIAIGGGAYIIASKSGEIITAVDGCPEGTMTACQGTGYGNYIDIKHEDGVVTRYGHLKPGTLEVNVGDQVAQGQIIAYMGNSGVSTGTHLHFEVRIDDVGVEPFDYVSDENPRPIGTTSIGTFNTLKTSLSKNEFVTLMKEYGEKRGGDFVKYFSSNAELIYDVSLKNNINPELVVVTAGTEQGFGTCDGIYNFWGINIPNGKGCSAGPKYANMTEGIKGYAELINDYARSGSEYHSKINTRYQERLKAKCAVGGYGTPDTLEGIQSIYSYLGDYWINPGSGGIGGCYYLKAFIDEDFMPEKYTTSYYNNKCPSRTYGCSDEKCIKTNVCERSDYTKWQVQSKVELRKTIFKIYEREN